MNSVGQKNSRTFAEASAEIQAKLQRHLDRQKSAKSNGNVDQDATGSEADSESDEDRQQSNDLDQASEEIFERIFSSYPGGTVRDADSAQFRRTKEAILSSRSACLICISTVKKNDPIWSCGNCFTSMHISCAQRWARDSIYQQKADFEDQNDPLTKSLKWCCPKCRQNYSQAEIPSVYTCFCGKVKDPEFDPWLTPHSCGELCDKELKPGCGHKCLILCHPGPCPPCPQSVTADCFCGNSAPARRRCYAKDWSCGKPCGKALTCGQHPCPLPCHSGECPPCAKTSVQLCQCRRNQKQCDCAEPVWQCKEVCGKKLSCGHHYCDLVCHSEDPQSKNGGCPPCPLSELRRCPCGKTTHRLACTLATPTCGDTCEKVLKCGQHVCIERCHRGECGNCLQMSVKTCRCGAKSKSVPCVKEFTCEIKCKKLRNCRKHPCNRKCCDGTECPPCEQICGKTLGCKNHKCASVCHPGPCYPCNETKEVTCNCGKSRILVPCGGERSTAPPKCKQKCKAPPDCHHSARKVHNCHFGECPTCKQTCDQSMKCGHNCQARCHDNVRVKANTNNVKAATPWEKNNRINENGPSVEIRPVECPECQSPVSLTCLGGHETSEWPCFLAKKAASCGRKCGRLLPCGNHNCQRDCHKVKNAPDEVSAGSSCRKCESECTKPRPEGCSHVCPKPCHPGECEPCVQMLRIRCHCELMQVYVKCGEMTSADTEAKAEMTSCKDQCPKLISCGHRCSKTCHPGPCSEFKECKKRQKLHCKCKRQKEERLCRSFDSPEDFSQLSNLECDDECRRLKEEERNKSQSGQSQQKEEELERLKRLELERFEKQMEGNSGYSKKNNRRNRTRKNRNSESSKESENPILRFFFAHIGKIVLVVGILAGIYLAYAYPGTARRSAPVVSVDDDEGLREPPIEDKLVADHFATSGDENGSLVKPPVKEVEESVNSEEVEEERPSVI